MNKTYDAGRPRFSGAPFLDNRERHFESFKPWARRCWKFPCLETLKGLANILQSDTR
jgi:hypothetical protein